MVVRQPDGLLRTATPAERDRILHIYDPRPGKMHKTPRMLIGVDFEVRMLHCQIYTVYYYSTVDVQYICATF